MPVGLPFQRESAVSEVGHLHGLRLFCARKFYGHYPVRDAVGERLGILIFLLFLHAAAHTVEIQVILLVYIGDIDQPHSHTDIIGGSSFRKRYSCPRNRGIGGSFRRSRCLLSYFGGHYLWDFGRFGNSTRYYRAVYIAVGIVKLNKTVIGTKVQLAVFCVVGLVFVGAGNVIHNFVINARAVVVRIPDTAAVFKHQFSDIAADIDIKYKLLILRVFLVRGLKSVLVVIISKLLRALIGAYTEPCRYTGAEKAAERGNTVSVYIIGNIYRKTAFRAVPVVVFNEGFLI